MPFEFIKQLTFDSLNPLFSNASRKFMVYDCEIIRCIPDKTIPRRPDLDYCEGWQDFQGMGIAVICAYTSWDDSYHIYLQDNLADFQTVIEQTDEIVGFNSLAFDDPLCVANNIKIKTTYDLLEQVRVAAGMPPKYVKGLTKKGYSLEALAQANLGYGKAITKESVTELWQKGHSGKVINYCLKDVMITRKLYEKRFSLIDPNTSKILTFTA